MPIFDSTKYVLSNMKKTLVSLSTLLIICLFFFWPIFKGFIPFPGDLLVNSNPYRSLSILGYNPGSYPTKEQGRDVITELYPWRYFTIQELKQGKIPFWNPHNFSGNILMQNLQSSVFNPVNLVFFFLPFTAGWTLFIFMQPVLASFFFFLFIRELKIGKFAALVGGIGFAFSSYMTVWMEYGNIAATLAYLPLLLFFLIRFLHKKSVKDYVGFIITAILMLLSGYIQGAFYSYMVVLTYTIYLLITEKHKINFPLVVSLIGMFVFPLFLTLFQFLPTLQIFSISTRWPYSLNQIQNLLQPPWYWITLLSADFFGNPATQNYYLPITYIERVCYIGVPLFIFALYAIFQKKKQTIFFTILAGIVILLTTNFPGIAYVYQLPIPVIDTTVPTRFLSIFIFSLVVVATLGIDTFFQKKTFPKKLAMIIALMYLLLWVGVFIVGKVYPQFTTQISITKHNLILPTVLAFGALLVFFVTKKSVKIGMALLFFLVVVDLFYGFEKITPFAPIQTVYPQNPVTAYMQQHAGINRFWGYGSGYIEPNFQTVTGTYSPEGNDPLHIKAYGELITSSYDGKLPTLPPRPDANLAQGYGQDGMKNPYRQQLLNLLGVKYIVQHDESQQNGNADTATFSPDRYSLVWSQNPWQIYENKQVLPRYFLVNSYKIASGQKALRDIYTGELSNTLILTTKPTSPIDTHATGTVALTSYGTQKITFSTRTNGSMLLFLSDTYFPSWKAMIDGKPTPILLADYAFRAVVVPPGNHTIVMYYYPVTFTLGILFSAIAFIIFLLSTILMKKYEK